MTASLRSNDGNTELSISLGSQYEYAHEFGFEGSVTLSSLHWDGDHTHPMHFQFDGLWLRRDDLVAIHTHISNWVGLPLSTLASHELIGEFELARLPRQSFALHFGPRKDTIAERKPVLTIKVMAGTLSTETHFVTDQSCLALFAGELGKI